MSDPVRIIQAQPGQIIHLGRVGEDGVTKVQFDISAYVAENTTYSVILSYATLDKIPIQFDTQLVGSAYPYYEWIITAEVTQYLGEGKAQLSITPQIFVNGHYEDDSSKRALSPWYQTLVTTSVYSELQETGDIQTWMDTLTQQLDEAQSIIDTSTGLSKVQANAHSLDYDEQATAGASWAAAGTSDYPQLNLDFGIPVGKPFVISDGKGSLKDLYAAWDADKSDTMYILNGPGEPENGWLYRQDVRSVPPTDPSIPRADSISNLGNATANAIKYLTYKTGNVIDYDMKYVGVALTSSQYSVVNTEPAVPDMDPGLIYFYKHSGNAYYTAYQKRVLNNTESIKEIVGYRNGSAPSGNIVYWNNTRYMYGWMYITDLSIAVGVGVENIRLYVENNIIKGEWTDSGNQPHAIQIDVTAITNAVTTATNAANTATNKASAAATSASNAATSASNAATSASNAATSAGSASNSAGSASTSAGTATTQALKAEGYAVGTQDGQTATSGQPYYHDNAKYYKEQANNAVIAANEYKEQAQNAADAAHSDAADALSAWQNLANADATATTLLPDNPATVALTTVDNHKRFAFGIPQGKGLVISGTVAAVSSLPTTASAGTCYGVGSQPPYNLYISDGATPTSNWINYGPVASASNATLGTGYGISTSNSATATATITDYQLSVGGITAIKFTNAVPVNATLNINNTGAKPIYWRGSQIPEKLIHSNDIAYFIYDGTNYILLSTDSIYVTAGQKANTTLGIKATAEGYDTTASSDYAHAEGRETVARGSATHAEGRSTLAYGDYAHAEGYSTQATGAGSHAEGTSSIATADDAHAEGHSTQADGQYSHAEGNKTIAATLSQHVFGEYNIADTDGTYNTRGTYVEIVGNGTGNNARANARTLDWSGNETLAGKLTLGAAPTNNMDAATKQYVDNHTPDLSSYMQKGVDYVTAGHVTTSTIANNATAEGLSNEIRGQCSHGEGKENSITAAALYAHVEGYQNAVKASEGHAEGYKNTVNGVCAHAEGRGNTVTGSCSHAEGRDNNTYGTYSHSEGNVTFSVGLDSHSEGHDTLAFGSHSHAEGLGNLYSYGWYGGLTGSNTTYTVDDISNLSVGDIIWLEDGDKAAKITAIDNLTITVDQTLGTLTNAPAYEVVGIAYGTASHSEGTYTIAIGDSSHVEGSNTTASGAYSHAEGDSTLASANASHAEGNSTEANCNYSSSAGQGTIANGRSQCVFGEYNIPERISAIHARGTYIEIVGKGTADNARSNARTLDWSGNERLAGSLTLGMNTANETTLTAAELAALKSPGTYNTSSFELTMPFTINVVNS